MESKGMTQLAFSQFTKISTASLSGILNGRTKPTLNTVEAIRNSFPNINIDWLMFGTGPMFIDGAATQPSSETQKTTDHADAEPSLDFGNNDVVRSESAMQGSVDDSSYKRVVSTPNKNIIPAVKYLDKPQRQITEIRVYFDDLTFETFVPEK